MKNTLIYALCLFCVVMIGCQGKYADVPEKYHSLLDSAFEKAGENAAELQKALDTVPADQKEGMAFIISYMPERDLTSISANYLITNSTFAYKAREEFPWCKALPDSVFFNEVLPYANISEERDPWREDYYYRFKDLVKDKTDLHDAVLAIANPIKDVVGVEYNTNRSKVDLSPMEAMKEKMATCTGLSIILVDAFRAVGIPSRMAGTPMWTNYKGNHTWTEVFIDGEWKFIEYYPEDLNKAWFLADAGKADPENMIHWIYAVSYKPTDLYYYAGKQVTHLKEVMDVNKLPEPIRKYWQMDKDFDGANKVEPYVYGVNRTEAYIDLYQKSLKENPLAEDETIANIVVFKSKYNLSSDGRVGCRIDVLEGDKVVDFGYAPIETDDMNKFMKVKLKKNKSYTLHITHPGDQIDTTTKIKTVKDGVQDFQIVLSEI